MSNAAAAAAAVLDAPDDAAREVAVLGVLKGVNIGVYTPDGEQVIAGGERSEGDFWVYDFQVSALAASVRDGDEIRLEAIAADLVELAATSGGGTFSVADVTSAVTDAAADVAANPTQPRAYALAVAIELGRQGRFGLDLANPPADAPVVLDGLSAFLVTVDLILPYVEAQEPARAAADLRMASTTRMPPIAAGCPPLAGANGWIAGISAHAQGLAGLAGVPNASFDRYLQGQLTGAVVDARLEGPRDWHHNHEDANGTATSTSAEYVYTLRLRVAVPTAPISCGSLSGAAFPHPEGSIVGAAVEWRHPQLSEHSQFAEEGATGLAGQARLSVYPIVERYPSGIGPEQRERVTITARANVLQALGGDLYTRLAGVPALQSRSVDVDVTWHRTYVVKVSVTSILVVTRGVTYNGELGTTSARGEIPVIEFRNDDQVAVFHGTEITNPGILTTTATPASTQGQCNTEWIEQKGGASREIDWQVRDLVVWPPDKLFLWMDTGSNTGELPDNYDGLICTPGGNVRLGPSPGNVWETMIFLSYPRQIRLGGTGPGKWTLTGSVVDTFARGGDLATWESQETCGGRCKGVLQAVLSVRPVPGP